MLSGLAHQNLEPNVSHEENEWDLPFGRVIDKGWMTCHCGRGYVHFNSPNKVKNILIKYTDRMSGRVLGMAYRVQA